MPFSINPDLIENNDVEIQTVDGELALFHKPSGNTLIVDEDTTVSEKLQSPLRDNVDFDENDLISGGSGEFAALDTESVNTDEASIANADPVTGGPIGSSGETFVVSNEIFGSLDASTTQDTFTNINASNSLRSIANWSNADNTNLENFRISWGIYELEETTGTGTAEFALGSLGDAPGGSSDPIPGSTISISDGGNEFRQLKTFSINIDDFGEWTPYPLFRAIDGGEARATGFPAIILEADIK